MTSSGFFVQSGFFSMKGCKAPEGKWFEAGRHDPFFKKHPQSAFFIMLSNLTWDFGIYNITRRQESLGR